MKSIKEYFRRGKAGKEHHHSTQSSVAPLESASSTLASSVSGGAPTLLPRTSSASANLNVLAVAAPPPKSVPQTSKSARGKGGGGSRDRSGDGTGTASSDDSRKQTLAAHKGERPVSGEDGLAELQQVQRQLQEMATEKSSLLLQLQERTDLVNDLQNEIKVLKIYQEQSAHQLDQKAEENAYLRSKLRDVVHSPLSDSEKQQLLLIDSHRHHSSAPASIAVNVPNDTGDATACPTPDWDKNSSSNVSDVSVACLQDKINQMQETHYSTNEELQATLQELTDLQRQLTELQLHNNRLGEAKNLMFDSLCRQTDRLKDTRSELDHLKQMLNTTQDNTTAESVQQYAEREAQLVDIVQQLEVERDNLRDRQQELVQDLQHLRNSNDQGEEERCRLIERVRMLEGSVDAKVAENRQTEQELSQVRDEYSGSKIEIDRLKDILESARTKIVELEQDRDLSDKSELGELLDTARKEKDSLELEITHLREQVAKSRNEIEKLREQVSILQEECKVTRNNAKCTQSELDYKVETLLSDKTNLIEQLQRLQETVGDFEVKNQCLNEDKRQLNGVLSETQRNLSEAEEKLTLIVEELSELKKLRDIENEDWEKFQKDLLISVRVANDFKTEAQQDLQKNVLENKGYRERVRLLEIQIDKLKGGAPEPSLIRSSIRRSIRVTPRKIEEEILPPAKGFENDDSIVATKKTSSKFKDHKNSKLIVLENKLQDANTTASEFKNNKPLVILENQTSSSSEVVDSPARKKLVDITDTTVYTGILAKPLTTKPVKSKPRKNRSKSLEKLLTEADAEKFKILGEMLAHIDQFTPIHLLNEEDRSLLKLKSFYDSREAYRLKPIARKPKHELCISNPLLNSVFANPALKKIAEDPKLLTVEAIPPQLELKESFSFTKKQYHSLDTATILEDDRVNKNYTTFKPPMLMKKSQSVSNLCDNSDDDQVSIKRFLTEEDLSRNFVIAPSDSKLSLNLWTGTYTFAKQPKVRTDSASSSNSDLHVYTVNEDINRSSSFVYESSERRKSLGNRKRFGFGSSEVIYEAKNRDVFAEAPEVVEVEAEVHHSLDSLVRPPIPKCVETTTKFDAEFSIGSKFEVQEQNVYLDFEEEATDSLRKRRALAESLCRSNFTEEEIELVQRVTEVPQSRPNSDINNDDIIVIEWIDYCDQCREVGTIALSLEEYSREIKSGRNISELDRITDLNEHESSVEQKHGLVASKQRASIKLDTLERKYNLKDDLEELNPNVSEAKVKLGALASKEFGYVEEVLSSWQSKTRRKMRSSIEHAGFELHGPISVSPKFPTDDTDIVALSSQTVKMTDESSKRDDDGDDDNSDLGSALSKTQTYFTLPKLDAPDDASKKTANAASYPTLERAAVRHVFNNNLPAFGKLNACIRGEPVVKVPQFQIGSLLRKESLDAGAENREKFVQARNKFLVAEEEEEGGAKGSPSGAASPRSSFHKPKSTND